MDEVAMMTMNQFFIFEIGDMKHLIKRWNLNHDDSRYIGREKAILNLMT
jgi:hypothetical protein